MPERSPATVRVFRVAMRAFPKGFRTRHGLEMVEAFRREESRRTLERGRVAALAYAVRAILDAVRQGWIERTRGGSPAGHGARRPPEPRRGGMLDGTTGDVRMAVRSLMGARGFTLAAVVVLALGIGANTTVFSALRMAVLSPTPYPDPESLVIVDLTNGRKGEGPLEPFPWSFPKFQSYLDAPDRLVDPAAGYASRSVTLTRNGPATRLEVELVSPGYFSILGRTPVRGRAFTPAEANPAEAPMVAVVSYSLWRSRFGSDASMLGRDVTLNGKLFRVVGVAPEGFRGLTGSADVWVPMAASATIFSRYMVEGAQAHWLHVVGRLRAGASFDTALEQTRAIGDAVAEEYPATWDPNEVYSASLRRFEDVRVNRSARASVLLLSVAAGLVLLVACANLSGLLLARARKRARDGAVRRAVGASRWRLVRASLVESLVLSTLGGGAGVAVAVWGTRAMAAAWPRQFLRSGEGEMRVTDPSALIVDPTVLGFALAVTVAAAILFGITPALRASRTDVAAHLRDGGTTTGHARGPFGLDARAFLVGAQVALALSLLVGAGLVGRSMFRLLRVDEGFRTDHLLTFRYTIPSSDARAEEPAQFHASFLKRIEALPGVESATIGCAPLKGHCSITLVDRVEGGETFAPGEGPGIGVNSVGDRHFEKLGIPVLRGRTLDERDGTDFHTTMVISQTAAQRLFPDQDPVGRRIRIGYTSSDRDELVEIVGVVGDVTYDRPDHPVMPEAYFSFREFGDRGATIAVRTVGDPLELVPAIRAELRAMDPDLALWDVATMDQLMARATGDRRVILGLLGLFALVTVLLAATGTWGIVSYSVADRRRELGLRIALGAGNGRVLGMVLRQSVRAAFLGMALGLAAAWSGSRLLESFLFETRPGDPWTYAGAGALLFGVVLLASYLPARRAVRVDPVEALKSE